MDKAIRDCWGFDTALWVALAIAHGVRLLHTQRIVRLVKSPP
jgi:hypothetical protein